LILYASVEVALLAAAAAAGFQALIFFLGQAALAVVLLELFNYIAHYGLSRSYTEGRLSKLGPHHCWNSARRMNNWSLFNMGRHGDHHRRPTAPYQALQAEPAAPELPFGYAGAILLALAPPLWRRAMDPRAALWSRVEAGELTLEAAGAEQQRLSKAGMFWPVADDQAGASSAERAAAAPYSAATSTVPRSAGARFS
jgi:alkane 1-monooxygenase